MRECIYSIYTLQYRNVWSTPVSTVYLVPLCSLDVDITHCYRDNIYRRLLPSPTHCLVLAFNNSTYKLPTHSHSFTLIHTHCNQGLQHPPPLPFNPNYTEYINTTLIYKNRFAYRYFMLDLISRNYCQKLSCRHGLILVDAGRHW